MQTARFVRLSFRCWLMKLAGCGLPPTPPTAWQPTQIDAVP